MTNPKKATKKSILQMRKMIKEKEIESSISVAVTITISGEMYEKLQAYAAERNLGAAEAANQILDEALKPKIPRVAVPRVSHGRHPLITRSTGIRISHGGRTYHGRKQLVDIIVSGRKGSSGKKR